LVRRFDQEEYMRATAVIEAMTNDVAQTRQRTRKVAERVLDVRRVGRERYVELYEQVFLG